jgi:hypothetical protein
MTLPKFFDTMSDMVAADFANRLSSWRVDLKDGKNPLGVEGPHAKISAIVTRTVEKAVLPHIGESFVGHPVAALKPGWDRLS